MDKLSQEQSNQKAWRLGRRFIYSWALFMCEREKGMGQNMWMPYAMCQMLSNAREYHNSITYYLTKFRGECLLPAACMGYFIFSAFWVLQFLCIRKSEILKTPLLSPAAIKTQISIHFFIYLLILSSPTIYSKIFSIKTYRHKWNRADPIKIWTHAIYRNDDWWVMNYLLLTCLSKSEKHTSNIIILLFNIFYFITVTFFFLT